MKNQIKNTIKTKHEKRAPRKLFDTNSRFLTLGFMLLVSFSTLGVAIAASPTQASPGPSESTNAPKTELKHELKIEKVEDGTLYFAAPAEGQSSWAPVKTGLFQVEALGVLSPEAGNPFVLVSALNCKECADQKFLHLFAVQGEKVASFVYPGQVRDRKNGRVLYDARAFYGKCLPGRADAYVAFQTEKVGKRYRTQQSVFMAEMLSGGRIDEKLVNQGRPSLTAALGRVKRKECFEIQGRARVTQSFKVPVMNGKDDEIDEAE